MSTESLQARLAAAAPGPWELHPQWENSLEVFFQPEWETDSDGSINAWNDQGRIYDEGGHTRADAELIAHAPTDLAAALKVIEAATEVLEAWGHSVHLRDALDAWEALP